MTTRKRKQQMNHHKNSQKEMMESIMKLFNQQIQKFQPIQTMNPALLIVRSHPKKIQKNILFSLQELIKPFLLIEFIRN